MEEGQTATSKCEFSKIIDTFTIDNLPDLDATVMAALELFVNEGLPKIDFTKYKRPLVIGSGNASVTGRIMFSNYDAVCADESTYLHELEIKKDIDVCIIISASGGKHSPLIAQELKKRNIDVYLLTCSKDSLAKEFIDENHIVVYPKQREPYTYNVSTYLGMILSNSLEDTSSIYKYIKENIDPLIPTDIGDYDGYYLIVPEKFNEIRQMFHTKYIELFGRRVGHDVFTPEQAKHATTVVPSKELYIAFGSTADEKLDWGEHKLNIPLPKDANFGAIFAIGYYVIGKIQSAKHPFFKENIVKYCLRASEIMNQNICPVVEK